MSEATAPDPAIDQRIASRLKSLRAERGWSLEALAERSGVSRSTLSRIENAETSATAAALGRLAAAFGLSISRLMHLAEDAFAPCVQAAAQPVWSDPGAGFTRRQVSPPATALAGEVVEARLAPGTRILYPRPPRPGLEHHLVLLEGRLAVTVDGATHALSPGDCLRYQLHGASAFETPPATPARYLLFTI